MHPHDVLEPGLALSGKPLDAAEVNELPFRGILNVSDFEAPRYARGLREDIELIRRPINDIYPVPLPYLLLTVLELAHLRGRGIETLVHCHAGRSRSPTVIALYWMARDGASWNEAIGRVQSLRPSVEPNRFFQTEAARHTILDAVRRFIGGEHALLAAARSDREELIRRLRQRAPDPADRSDDWNLLEAGLAIGSVAAARESLVEHGFAEQSIITHPEDAIFDPASPTDIISLRRTLQTLRARGETGEPACLLSGGDEFSGLFTICALLVLERGWDIGTAIWYLGSRRQTLWQHVDVLWAMDWQTLRSTYQRTA